MLVQERKYILKMQSDGSWKFYKFADKIKILQKLNDSYFTCGNGGNTLDKIEINLFDLILCLSNAQDLVSPDLTNHHQQVAYLSYRLADQLKLPVEEQKVIIHAALVHDIGILSMNERMEIVENEPIKINNHAFRGAKLLNEFKPLEKEAHIVKYHHLKWENGKGQEFMGEEVSYGSHIIHLADRVCALIRKNQNVLSQIPNIIANISKKKELFFEAAAMEALQEISEKEYIWLDLVSQKPVHKINVNLFDNLILGIDDIIDFASMLAQMIDFRSNFTSRHSAGVAKTAQRLAQLIGFSVYECKLMLAAGYLHDIGKIAIDNVILEKPAKLSQNEFNEIRSHTYYTYQLLDSIPQFQSIKTWAAYHHERMDGKGYPFHITGDKLSLGARILAVADIFTALTEDRPYRDGMDDIHSIQVLHNMVMENAIDGKIVNLLIEHYDNIKELRENAQQEASRKYENFLNETTLIGCFNEIL